MIPVSKQKIQEYTAKGYWGKETILDLLYSTAEHSPEDIALVDPVNRSALVGDDPKRYTYARMSRDIHRIAAGFEACGLGTDDVILVQLPNIAEAILVYFAAARIGAIASPLSVMARSRELSTAIELTQAKAIVTLPAFNGFDHAKMVRELEEKYGNLKHHFWVGPERQPLGVHLADLLGTDVKPAELSSSPSGPNHVFSICWTSGTEAAPKGVPHTHNEWLNIARVVVEGCQMERGYTIHGSFPVINMAGMGGLMVPWVITGGKFVLHHPFDPEVFFAQLAEEEIDYTLMPPALLDNIAKSPQAEALGRLTVKKIASGSVPLSPWMVRFYEERFGIGIVNFFASNEGVALFSAPRFFPAPEDRATYFPRFGKSGIVWDIPQHVVGGIRSKLVDPVTEEEITESGKSGELRFAGPSVFSGYWGRPDLTERAFDDEGFYCTGDLFSIDGENRDKFLFQGRFKDLIIRGGVNISPEEVETVIIGHHDIQEAAAVGYPDARLNERTCVVVVPKPGKTITLEEIIAFMEEKGVARYKFPERLEIMDALPRNAVQKVLRRKIKEWLMGKMQMEN